MALDAGLGIDRRNGCGPGEVSRIRLNVSAVRNRLARLEDVEEDDGIGRLEDDDDNGDAWCI